MASAFAALAIPARSQTHGPHFERELESRVSTTVAPCPSSNCRSCFAIFQFKVASGNPALVAVPVVLQPLTMAPLNLVALISLANSREPLPN